MMTDTHPADVAAPSLNGPVMALIPAHDEERFVASVILKAKRFVDEVVVIDDGSTDDTPYLAEASGAIVIRQPHNQGKAAALNAGLDYARQRGAGAAILIDGDGQQDANDIPHLLKPILADEADVVVGSRFLGTDSPAPPWRIFGQRALTLATNMASGVRLTDSQSGYRALSRRALEKLSFRTVGFSLESEMQFLIKQHHLIVREVPIVVNYDEGPKRNPVRHGLQVLNGILRMIGQHRPLLFFGVPGAVLLMIGGALMVDVIDRYNQFPQLAVGRMLLSAILLITGLLSVFTGIILHTIRAYVTEGNISATGDSERHTQP